MHYSSHFQEFLYIPVASYCAPAAAHALVDCIRHGVLQRLIAASDYMDEREVLHCIYSLVSQPAIEKDCIHSAMADPGEEGY